MARKPEGRADILIMNEPVGVRMFVSYMVEETGKGKEDYTPWKGYHYPAIYLL